MLTAAALLIREGYPPEPVLTDLYLSGAFSRILEQASEHGLMHALKLGSLASQYGTLSRFERFNELKMERLMEMALEEIRGGKFSQEWSKEYAADYPRLKQLMKNRENMELWELEQQTLELLGRDSGEEP
jgi:ketol-acid reductoisomerase